MRESGILMHITSLPSPYGVGTMGKEAFRFVDFLAGAGQRYWQILPVTPPTSPVLRMRETPISLTWTFWWKKVCSKKVRSQRSTGLMFPTV